MLSLAKSDFEISVWLDEIESKLKTAFKDNLIFIGLQGSYNRNEADENSDIDLVVILKHLSIEDLREYKSIIEGMPFKEKACGFISGEREIKNWSKEDLFQFFYDTGNIYGKLEEIITPPTNTEVKKSIKQSLETLYHSAIHSYLHSSDFQQVLPELYKQTFFILQAEYFVKNNEYIKTKKELLTRLTGLDKDILLCCINRKDILKSDKSEYLFTLLIEWLFKQMSK